MTTKSVWKPINKGQEEALSRSEFEVLVGGERGGGKSEIGRVWLCEPEYINHPMYRALILRKNSVDLHDWIFRFKAQFPQCEIAGNPPTIKFPGGGLGTLGHLANKDSWSHYVGHEYQKMLVEEINLIPDETRYLMLLGSCRSSIPELKPQLMASANPGNVGHFWVKKRWVDVANGKTYIDPQSGLSRIFIRLKLRDNFKLPLEYEQTLRLLPKAIQKAWIEGDWDALAGLFFTTMPEIEKPKNISTDTPLYGSFDFGSSATGHSSFGLWYLENETIPHRVFTWYHKLGHTAGEQAYELAEYVKSFPLTNGRMPVKVYADPAIFAKNKEIGINATPKSVADYFIEQGFPFVPANNSRVNGWRIMQDYFSCDPLTKQPKMYVFDGYNNTLFDHINMQVHDDDNPDDIAPNDFDHVVDECRYGLTAFHSFKKPEERRAKVSLNLHNFNYSQTGWMAA